MIGVEPVKKERDKDTEKKHNKHLNSDTDKRLCTHNNPSCIDRCLRSVYYNWPQEVKIILLTHQKRECKRKKGWDKIRP